MFSYGLFGLFAVRIAHAESQPVGLRLTRSGGTTGERAAQTSQQSPAPSAVLLPQGGRPTPVRLPAKARPRGVGPGLRAEPPGPTADGHVQSERRQGVRRF